jgi:hypothetical protein
MAALLDYLTRAGVATELRCEPSGANPELPEPAIFLKGQNLSAIRLSGAGSGGCSVAGDILRFEYEVRLPEKLNPNKVAGLSVATRTTHAGKASGLPAGPVTGVKWRGGTLARALNSDPELAAELARCAMTWAYLEFEIAAASPRKAHILGPRFTNPGTIAEVYESGQRGDIENCIFGFKTMERMAGHILAAAPAGASG